MAGKTSNDAGSSSNRSRSLLIDAGRRKSSCGYCRSGSDSSISHGLWAHSLTVYDYQDLLDRGWRRSGCFLYKPKMNSTCCPAYTIRLRAADFKPSKEQQRVSRRMERFLDGKLDMKAPDEDLDEVGASKGSSSFVSGNVSSSTARESLDHHGEEENSSDSIIDNLSEKINHAVCTMKGEFPSDIQLPKVFVKSVPQGKKKLLVDGAEDLLYTSNIAFQIAAAVRKAQSAETMLHQEKFLKAGKKDHPLSLGFSPAAIAVKLAGPLTELTEISGLSVRACNGHINFYAATKQAFLERIQLNTRSEVSNPKRENKRCYLENNSQGPPKRRKLEMHLKRSRFDPKEYALYKKYQIKVHNDEPDHVTESSYRRFLVDSPLISVRPTDDGTVPPCGFGSFHQQYIVDGQLIAVGVVDILPKCLSSKYLFWDPDFAYLSLGKYSALQEIGWVKENQNHCPSLEYYYLGYYIHSCPKMRYKAAYRPSELLCPLRYQWVPFDVAKPLIDQKPYAVISDFTDLGNGKFLPPAGPQSLAQPHQDDSLQEDYNDIPLYEENYDESSVDDSSSEESESIDMEVGDISNVMIGMNGSSFRYKDISLAFDPNQRTLLESLLRKYKKVVGAELAERMIYSLG